jgi:hypothetical protein
LGKHFNEKGQGQLLSKDRKTKNKQLRLTWYKQEAVRRRISALEVRGVLQRELNKIVSENAAQEARRQKLDEEQRMNYRRGYIW